MSGLFRQGYQPPNQILGGIRVQTSLQGVPIVIVYGRTRIPGNLIWYGDFIARSVTSGGKKGGGGGGSGKKGGGEYDYGAALAIGLCQGPIIGIGAIWSTQGNLPVNETQETYTVPPGGGSYQVTQYPTILQDLGVTRGDSYSVTANDFGSPGSITLTGTQQVPMARIETGSPTAGQYLLPAVNTGTYSFGAGDAGKTMTITYTFAPPLNSGGTAQDPITTIGFTSFDGALGQAVWSYLTSLHASQAIGYSGLAYVATPEFDLGMSGTLPNLSFEVVGLLPSSVGSDCNPSDVLYDLLTNAVYGCGIDPSEIGSMSQYSNYCIANGLFISPVLDTQRTAADWIRDILDATNAEIIETDGKLVIASYGDTTVVANGATYTPQTNPVYDLDDSDFIRMGQSPAVQVERPTIQDAFNSVRISYLDRNNSYNPSVVEAQDLQAIDAYKYRPEGIRQYNMFVQQKPAALAAQTILSRLVYIRNQYKFKLPQKYVLLNPMDIVTVTVEELDLDEQPVRIKTIRENSADKTFDIEAEEFPWGGGPTLYPKESSTPGGPNAYAPPGAINTPIIFEALSRLNDQIGHTVWFGLSGANPNWGGCRIWVSLDGVTYQQAGTAIGPTKMGKLTFLLPATADPDTSDTLAIDVSSSLAVLQSFTPAECNAFASLCYVGTAGVGELISYQDATVTGSFTYNLGTILRRGVYNSAIAAHAVGDDFMFLDNTVEGWDYDVGLIGQRIHLKFTSFNRSGLVEENIADVTDYPYTITGSSIGLLTPAHASYRPLTNPLTAIDAGAAATINVAAFSMQVPGQPDIAFGGGSVTGLDYGTLYYVYFDDPGFVSITPTYEASTGKSDAIDAAGRFFVGSIYTPAPGFPQNAGNNDGGAGAQIGMVSNIAFTSATSTVVGGSPTVTNLANALDNDPSTYAEITCNAGTPNDSVTLTFAQPVGIARNYSQLIFRVTYELITNTVSPQTGANIINSAYYSVDISHLSTLFSVPDTSSTGTITDVSQPDQPFLYPQKELININISVPNSATAGQVKVRIYGVFIESVE